jgi:RNA polymerase sigma factor (sigma-70 family)
LPWPAALLDENSEIKLYLAKIPGRDMAKSLANSSTGKKIMTDADIWERFKQGSEADFTFLYQHFAPQLFKYGCKLTDDRDLVKDSLQLVFFNIWKRKEQLLTPPSVLHYLLKATRNEIFKNTKSQRRFTAFTEDISLEVTSSFETEWISSQAEASLHQKVSLLLGKLPARQQEVIFLKYYKNLSYAEIAGIMDIEQQSVYKLTYKAIEKLQRLFLLTGLFWLLFI